METAGREESGDCGAGNGVGLNRRALISLAVLVALLVAATGWRLAAGGSLAGFLPEDRATALALRGWRVLTGATVGICLATAGVLLQALLRNPLASPDVMGMSSAASLGVMISLFAVGGAEAAGLSGARAWQALPALVGALGALVLVYALSQRRGLIDPTALVLIGVVVSVMCGSGVLLVQHLTPGAALSPGALRMLVGSISDDVSKAHLVGVGVVAMIVAGLAAWLGPAMDAASLGDDEAASIGVAVRRLRLALLALAGVLTAGAVVLAGPLGFVGLVAPHAVRLLAGPGLGHGGSGRWGGNRLVVIGSVLAGPTLVIAADALVKTLRLESGQLPIGVVTGLVGGATFIALLRAERRR